MAKTNDVSVSLYEVNGKLRVIAQLTLDGIAIEKDDSGRMIEDKRQALREALEEAIRNWAF